MSNKSAFFTVETPLVSLVYNKALFLKILFILANLSFLTTLNLPYQGEEGVYTITSLEMWYQKEWIRPLFYGLSYGRPPLFNWFIIPLASFLGMEHVLLASRLIAVSATFASSLMLFWLTRQLFRDKNLALFASVLYLSGDLLFKRGWLAYADPLFSLCVFSSISLLWMGLEKKQVGYLALANLALVGGFLAKALTAYCFYGLAFLVLFWRHENRRFLFSPLSILLHVLSLLFPIVWNHFSGDGAHHSEEMIIDVVSKLTGPEFKQYFSKLIIYPFSTLLYWMPGSGILLYLFWQMKKQKINIRTAFMLNDKAIALLSIAFWILLLNYIPYWLAPQNRIRYILPLYPLFALMAAVMIYQAGEKWIRVTNMVLGALILVKFFFGFYGYAWMDGHIKSNNYLAIVEDIRLKIGDYPLYVDDCRSCSLSITSQLDILRLPNAPLTRCDRNIVEKMDGRFHLVDPAEIVKHKSQHPKTQLFKEYQLGRNKIYLLCEGKACQKG